jgi:hypothetical protein
VIVVLEPGCCFCGWELGSRYLVVRYYRVIGEQELVRCFCGSEFVSRYRDDRYCRVIGEQEWDRCFCGWELVSRYLVVHYCREIVLLGWGLVGFVSESNLARCYLDCDCL